MLDTNDENNFILSRILTEKKIKLLQQPLRQPINRLDNKNKTIWNIDIHDNLKNIRNNKKYMKFMLNTDYYNRKSQQQAQDKESTQKWYPKIFYNQIDNKKEQQNSLKCQQNTFIKPEYSIKFFKKPSVEVKKGLLFSKKKFQQRTNSHNQIEAPLLNYLFKNYQIITKNRKGKQQKYYPIVKYQKKQIVPKQLIQRKLISCSENRKVNSHLIKAKLNQNTIRIRQNCKKFSKQLQKNNIYFKNKSIDIGISPW